MTISGLNPRANHPRMEEYKLEGSYTNPFYVNRKYEIQWSIYWFGRTFVKPLSPGGYFMHY